MIVAFALALAAFAQDAPAHTPATSQVHIRRADAAAGSIGVGEVVYLSPEGARDLGQMLLTEGPGYRTPVHIHHRTDESFHVLSGTLTLWVDGQMHELTAGDYVFIPRGTPHAQGNRGTEPARLLLSVAPGDFIGFFRAREVIVQTTPSGHPDYGPRMSALGEDFDIEDIGPPPF